MSASAAKPGGKRRARVAPKRKRAPAPEILQAEFARQRAADPLKPLTTAQDLATYDIAGSFVGAGIEPDEAFRLAAAEMEAREGEGGSLCA